MWILPLYLHVNKKSDDDEDDDDCNKDFLVHLIIFQLNSFFFFCIKYCIWKFFQYVPSLEDFLKENRCKISITNVRDRTILDMITCHT